VIYFSWLDVGRLVLASYFVRVLSIWVEMIETDIYFRFGTLPYRLKDYIYLLYPGFWKAWSAPVAEFNETPKHKG